MNINDSTVSPDGALKATLKAFDPKSGQGRLKIEELKAERGAVLRDGDVWQGRTDEDRLQNLRRAQSVRVPLYHQPE